jgi:hypothetical protein
VAAFLVVTLVSGCTPTVIGTCNGGGGRNVNFCLGFPSGSPSIDGNIKTDGGWANAFRYILGTGNGTSVAHIVVHGTRGATMLNLGFEVHNDASFDANDAIVLAFDPTGDEANMRRFHIYPVSASGAGGGGIPQRVDYWKDKSTWNSPAPATPSWVTDNIRVSSEGPPAVEHNHYYVEVAIPIVAGPNDNGINLPSATDDFGFYFTVVDAVTSGMVTNHVSEESWPIGANVGSFLESTPEPSAWGNGTLGSLANGVSVTSLYTNQTPNYNIEEKKPNTFYADVTNNMVTSGGAQATANQVRAEFRFGLFGIPSEMELIPSSPNPTGFANIPGNSHTFQSDWTLTPAQQTQYGGTGRCSRVDITSNGPDTLIVNKTATRNLYFVDTQSPFDQTARIGVRGYRLSSDQREHVFLLTEYRFNTRRGEAWQSELSKVEPFTSAGPLRQYIMRIPASQVDGADLTARVTPPNIKIPREVVKLPPGSRGEARIRVQPGNIVTVFASGSIVLRKGEQGPGGLPIGPNGQNLKVGERSSARGRFLLNDDDAPETRVGAVVASPDGFKGRSLAIGSETTFQVPPGVTQMAFAINDTVEGSKLQTGEGFSLEVIQTRAEEHYRHTTSLLDRQNERRMTRLPLGQNLPTWIICGERRTGGTLTINGTKYERYDPVGCFGAIVKSIGGL